MFFCHFTTVKKTRPPLSAERLSCLYTVFSGLLINMQYVKRVCGKIVFIVPNFLMYMYHRKIKGSEAFLIIINFVHKRIGSPQEHYTIMLTYVQKCRSMRFNAFYE